MIIGFAADRRGDHRAAAEHGDGGHRRAPATPTSITSFLGTVQLYTSVIGFVIQVWLTSKIQRYLGIGFALMILPIEPRSAPAR